jgi:NTP pyrophosphatase (non-canonical NTP hydrolase)
MLLLLFLTMVKGKPMGSYIRNGQEVIYIAGGVPVHIADTHDVKMADAITQALNGRSSNYIHDARRTLSPAWRGDLVAKHNFVTAINDAIKALNALDKVKKSIFYGRDNNLIAEGQTGVMDLPDAVKMNGGGNPENIIHAIIGIATEAGELLEALREAYNGNTVIDYVNIKEEAGDSFWYHAILANEADYTFEQAQSVNIAKLKARFPDAFSETNANERDLEAERAILEIGTVTVKIDAKEALANIGELSDLLTHYNSWRKALIIARDNATPATVDSDDRSYWQHELNVFDRTFAIINGGDYAPVAETEPNLTLKPANPATGAEAVTQAAQESAAAFEALDNVGSGSVDGAAPMGNSEHSKGIGYRNALMPGEELSKQPIRPDDKKV